MLMKCHKETKNHPVHVRNIKSFTSLCNWNAIKYHNEQNFV